MQSLNVLNTITAHSNRNTRVKRFGLRMDSALTARITRAGTLRTRLQAEARDGIRDTRHPSDLSEAGGKQHGHRDLDP
ncbi:protein of unknown function [Pararobbsia alpina]